MSMSSEATLCSYCGLPLVGFWRRRAEAGADEPRFCCYGCRFASEVAGQAGAHGEANWMLARLGLAIFLTLNVLMFTMALWTQDVYQESPDAASALTLSLDGLFRYLALVLSLPVLWLLGGALAAGAWRDLRSGQPSTDLLLVLGVAASYAYSAVSVVRGAGAVYFEVGCVVLVMVTLGRWLEATGKLRTTEALDSLEKLLPAEVSVICDSQEKVVSLSEVRCGDRLRVRAGERFAVDGRILRGRAAVDEQVFTGESQPAVKEPGDAVLSGTLNLDGDLLVEVTAAAEQGSLRRLIAAVHEARLAKGAYQRLADRAAQLFLPAVAAIALVSAGWHAAEHGPEAGVMTGMAVLLIACPCALGLATPLAVWAALGRAAQCQVVYRNGEALERLAQVRGVVFDKTGTLTTNQCTVAAFAIDRSTPRETVLQEAASLAASSTHTFSRAIAEFAGPLADLGQEEAAAELRTLPGRGLSASVARRTGLVYLGSPRLMEESGLTAEAGLQAAIEEFQARGCSLACVGWEGRVRGVFAFDESLREEAAEAVDACRRAGLAVTVATGDSVTRGERIGEQLRMPVEAALLPHEKVATIERLRKSWHTAAMVGDGINDAPALAAADVGIALGCGADVSRQSAEVCLLGNDLRRVAWAVSLSRAAVRTIRQNLFWAFFYNALGIALAAAGQLNPIWAAAAMTVSSVLVIGNSLRLTTWNC
ncbi:MAG TPA: cation-translocating P-type ATPase [Pirellulales bacterium]|nr:cation-translocating P-type ATPase [Pirellulales bacterium]